MKKLLSKVLNANVHPIVVGGTGLIASQTTALAMNTDTIQTSAEIASAQDPATLLIQIVIAIATLYKMFRKNKDNNANSGN
jgi:hypothetical protein